MDSIPQSNSYKIKYYNQKNYREMDWVFEPPRFLHFTYYYNQELPESEQGLESSWFKMWIDDVNDLRAGLYDRLDLSNPFTHFTKLPYMYYELFHNDCYKYPIFYSPWKQPASGGSRMLVLSQYFPNKPYDMVKWNIGKRVTNTLDDLVDSILKNSYWQNHMQYMSKFDEVRVLIETETFDVNYVQGPHPDPYFYWANQIEFTNPAPYVFSKDWTNSVDHVESYDYRKIVDKIQRTYELWENIKILVKDAAVEQPQDYKDLLDKIVFENLDFVKNWYLDFADK